VARTIKHSVLRPTASGLREAAAGNLELKPTEHLWPFIARGNEMLQSDRESNRQAMNGLLSGDQMLFCASASAAESHLVAHCFPSQATVWVGLAVACAAYRGAVSDGDKATLEVKERRDFVVSRSRNFNKRPSNRSAVVSLASCLL
jgi:hypothetical protein